MMEIKVKYHKYLWFRVFRLSITILSYRPYTIAASSTESIVDVTN